MNESIIETRNRTTTEATVMISKIRRIQRGYLFNNNGRLIVDLTRLQASERSLALTRTKAIIIVVLVGAAGLSFYLFNAIVAGGGYPPFCSGYPPGGNCHANYRLFFHNHSKLHRLLVGYLSRFP